MFGDLFDLHGDRPFIIDAQGAVSYAEALALGRSIIGELPRARSLVLLRCALDRASIATYAALLVDGHVPLLLEDSLSEELWRGIAATYRPDAIITPADTLVEPGEGAAAELHADLALLLTTSGSTGSPRLVRLSHKGVRANAEAIAAYLGLTSEERPLLHLPMSYSYGMSIINSHIVAGGAICLTQSTVMEPGYWDDLRHFGATSVSGVPFHYTAIRRLGEARLDIPSLRTLTQAGGRLDPRLASFFAEWTQRTGRRFFIMYGQTEAGPRISYLPPDKALTAPEAIGVPVDGVTIDLLDADGAPVPDGTDGEMVVRGASVMMGYAERAEDLALGDLLGGVLHTGDLANRGEDGLLRITGRRSRILKIYGLRLNIDEVESKLGARGYALHCFGVDDSLRVLVEGAAETAVVRKEIVDLFSLPPRGIEVRVTDRIERTPSGKISAAARDIAWEGALTQ
jgi:acyl-coenzyme A synthetase/AMP-(fatty) acid ligase